MDASDLNFTEFLGQRKTRFLIPVYQRNYDWKKDQCKQLLDDIERCGRDNKIKAHFLGSIVYIHDDVYSASRIKELTIIDGQQRFTTLWLIANYLQNDLTSFLEDRLHFSIRDNANHYFNAKDIIGKKEELKDIQNAEQVITSFFNDKEHNKRDFSHYLFTQLELVFTTVPSNVDLNKLFETINSGGVQLQHHELLKSKLLESLKESPNEQKIYSKLWDSCLFMENYVENNLAVSLNCTKKDIYTKLYENDDLKDIDKILEFIKTKIDDKEEDRKSLEDILSNGLIEESSTKNSEKEDELKVQSIISFPMLLLHTLRIYLTEVTQPQKQL